MQAVPLVASLAHYVIIIIIIIVLRARGVAFVNMYQTFSPSRLELRRNS